MNTWTKYVVMTGLAATVATSANISRADVDYQINITQFANYTINVDTHLNQTVVAGAIDLTQNPLNNDPAVANNFVTLCTDVLGSLHGGFTYSFAGPTAFSGNNGIAPQYWGAGNVGSISDAQGQANANAAIQVAAAIFYSVQSGLQANTLNANTVQAAQLAIWTALYNTSNTGGVIAQTATRFTITTALGNVNTAGTVANLMAADLAAADLVINGGTTYSGNLLLPDPVNQPKDTSPTLQGVFYTVVPEPSTIIAGVLVLLPFGASTIRILRKKNTVA